MDCSKNHGQVVLADWEAAWPQFKFNDIFSLFGVPMLQLDQKAENLDMVDAEDTHDDRLLSESELSKLQPMRVVARLRPILPHEEGDTIAAEVVDDFTVSHDTLHHGYVPARHTLQFDAALCCSQAKLFEKSGVKALVHRACEGYTCSIFAYGQTGAGKCKQRQNGKGFKANRGVGTVCAFFFLHHQYVVFLETRLARTLQARPIHFLVLRKLYPNL